LRPTLSILFPFADPVSRRNRGRDFDVFWAARKRIRSVGKIGWIESLRQEKNKDLFKRLW